MYCKNCGANVDDFSSNCPNCGSPMHGEQKVNNGAGYGEPIKTTGLLVWSIIELICVNQICGIIALIFYFAQLRPAVERNDIVGANKAKRNMKITLWIGLAIIPVILILIMLIAIPNFSGIQQRTQVRSDKVTAAQIGKAVRVWYVDAPFESFEYRSVEDGFVPLDEVDGLENYISPFEPSSYRKSNGRIAEAEYYVTIKDEGSYSSKVVVAIGPKDKGVGSRDDINFSDVFSARDYELTTITYDGKGSGIAYIEP